jgi:hypothetical protein
VEVAKHSNVADLVTGVGSGIVSPVGVGTPGDISLDLVYGIQTGLNR